MLQMQSGVFWGSSISDIYTKMAVGKYFVSFTLKSLKSNGFRQNIIYQNTDHFPMSFLAA